MRILRRVLVLAVLGALAWLAWRFATANASELKVDLLYASWTAPAWLALLAATAVGALLASVLLLYELARVGLVARRYRKAVHGLESEVHQLRNLPLAGGEVSAPAALQVGERGTAARAS